MPPDIVFLCKVFRTLDKLFTLLLLEPPIDSDVISGAKDLDLVRCSVLRGARSCF